MAGLILIQVEHEDLLYTNSGTRNEQHFSLTLFLSLSLSGLNDWLSTVQWLRPSTTTLN